jgi:hypothetical protein
MRSRPGAQHQSAECSIASCVVRARTERCREGGSGNASRAKQSIGGCGARAAGAPATWRYILRCVQLLATLSTHGISRSVPSPSSPSSYARASPLSPCWPAPRHTRTQSRPNDHLLRHQVTTPIPTRTYYFETRRSVVGDSVCSAGSGPAKGGGLVPMCRT